MRIGIQRERCRVVSQILLNGFDIECKKIENDTQFTEAVRRMIFIQNCIDDAPRLYDDWDGGPGIKITDIYKNQVIQCIIDMLNRYERPYKNEP